MRLPLFMAAALILGAGVAGCKSNSDSVSVSTHYYYMDTDSDKGGGQIAEDPSKVSEKAVTKADLVGIQKVADDAEAAMKKDPSAANKKAFVEANDHLASSTMYCDDLDNKVKYKQALHLYRQSLKVAPNDAEAKQWTEMIVTIYKHMKRPVPQD